MSSLVIVETSYINPAKMLVGPMECFPTIFLGDKDFYLCSQNPTHLRKSTKTPMLQRCCLPNDFCHWKTSLDNTKHIKGW